MRPLTLLRRAAYTLVGLLLAVFLLVQFQQRLLRHRAERLHAEILALQLHPQNSQEVNEGIALDPSAGEIYDSINEPGARDFIFTLLSPL